MFRTRLLVPTLATLAIASVATADVTLSSPDGRWVATIKDVGGGAGQCTSMQDMSLAPAYRHFLANTIHFVRIGSPTLFGEMETKRMESHFTAVRFVAAEHSFTAVLAANDLSGTVAMVNGEMVSGAAGGLRVSISFMDAAPSDTQALQTEVKPFVYANLNVDGGMTGNIGGWSAGSPNGHFWQKRNGSPANSERWFVGAGVDGIQAMSDSFMLAYLDNGATELMNQVFTGPGDINTAMSWPSANINDESYTVCYGVGDANLFVNPTFGNAPNQHIAHLFSSDSRWHAEINTNFFFPGNLAGQLVRLEDQSRREPEDLVTGTVSQHMSVGPDGNEQIRDIGYFGHGMHMWIAPNSRRSTAILRHAGNPGVVTIFDALMVPGESGGYVGCTTHVSTVSTNLILRGFLNSNTDVAGFAMNEGGLQTDHFWLTAPDSQFGDVRWIRSTAFSSHILASAGVPSSMLYFNDPLTNTVETGVMDLEWAFGYEPRQLVHNVPFVYGFAVGNPNIAIPGSFCTPTDSFPCPGDVNGDHEVDASDLSLLLGNWGPWQPTSPDTDFTDDGVTDAADLGVLLGSWGDCP